MFSKSDRPAPLPPGFPGAVYIDFIARLSRLRETRNYLEVGVHFGDTLCRVACDTAVGVDPGFVLNQDVTRDKRRTLLHRMTSDRFFAEIDVAALLGGRFDLAFLDGLHQFEFLLRDFCNAERWSEPNGLILLHDCMPLNAEMAARDDTIPRSGPLQAMWTGDVWKVVPILRRYRPDLEILLVDCPPTGLVCVSGLDPTSRVLEARYLDIVREFRALGNAEQDIAAMYAANTITPAEAILNGRDHSLYFRA